MKDYFSRYRSIRRVKRPEKDLVPGNRGNAIHNYYITERHKSKDKLLNNYNLPDLPGGSGGGLAGVGVLKRGDDSGELPVEDL